MADLVLSVWSAKPPHWSAIVAERAGFGSIADEGGATLDEARDAVLAQLTPEQLADLRESLIGDLAAVAKAMGYTVERQNGGVVVRHVCWRGASMKASPESRPPTRRLLLGQALLVDTLRREQEAADA